MTARRLGGVLALTLALGAGACSGGAARPAPVAPPAAPTAAGAAPPPASPASYPVGLRVLPLRRGPDRPLPTLVFYPATPPRAAATVTRPKTARNPPAAGKPGNPPGATNPRNPPAALNPRNPPATTNPSNPPGAFNPGQALSGGKLAQPPMARTPGNPPAARGSGTSLFPTGAGAAARPPADRRTRAAGGMAWPGRAWAKPAARRAILRQVRKHGTLTYAVLGAPPAVGRFPLVIFSHGLSGSPEWCAAALAAWASAGFVVAAPTFPYTSEFARDYRRGDIVNQPDDVRFVLDRVRRLDVAPGDALRGRINGRRVAAVGHSAGGYTTSGLFTAGHDPRLRAGVIMAGWAAPGAFAGPPATMLFLQGTADPVVPPEVSRAAFERVPWVKSYVLMRRISHANYLRPRDRGYRRMTTAVTAFLRRTLNAEGEGESNVGGNGNRYGSVRACGSRAQWDACFAVPSSWSSRSA